MIDRDSSSDDESTSGGKSSRISPAPRTARQQRELFKSAGGVPGVSIESVDSDVDVPFTSVTSSVGKRFRGGSIAPTPSRSPSPSPVGFLERNNSCSSNSSLSRRDLTESNESDFVIVSRSSGRRVSDALSQWTMIGDDLSGGEDNVNPETSLAKSLKFERSQLYLLLAHCISYPFTARYQLENSPPKQKLTEERLKQITKTLNSTLAGDRLRYQDLTPAEQKTCSDPMFNECVQWYVDVVLERNDIISVCQNGSFSAKELVAIFKVRASKHLTYSSPSRILDTEMLQLWTNTFRKLVERCSRAFSGSHTPIHEPPSPGVTGTTPNPDKLYRLFQKILKIRSIEHQILYSECQLGNPEEQEAVVRRELQYRKKRLEDWSSTVGDSTFKSRKVEEIYREEQLKMLKVLSTNLDNLSLSGSAISPAQQRKKRAPVLSESGNVNVTSLKHDLQFKLKAKVTIHDLTGIPSSENKPLFCVFEVEGGGEQLKTQGVQQRDGVIRFVEEGEFWTHSPLPQIKFTLMAVSKGLISDNKTIAKRVHVATPSSTDVYSTLDLYKSDKDTSPFGKLKVSTVVERPAIIKKCGYMSASGDYMFKQLKKRFFALIQLSQYKFILTTYLPGHGHPKVTLLLDQKFSVEFPTTEDQRLEDPEATVMFVLVSEESEVGRIRFGCRDNTDRESWMKWMVRATGQNFDPQPSVPEYHRAGSTDLDRYGLQEVVDSVKDITKIKPHKMFVHLFKATLEYRLKEDVFSRGLFSPAQMYVLDEFCARYGVRDPFRHLTCLNYWLMKEEEGQWIWPVMMLSSFRFCQMHVGGLNPPEKSVIVTADEREKFVQVCQDLEELLSKKIQKFRTCFPFGFPKDDLKVTLKLFDLVASLNHRSGQSGGVSPIKLLTNILEKAALLNYKQIFSGLQVENEMLPLTMSQLTDLAHHCIQFMYELHDYYWEDFTQYTQVFSAHLDSFWLFFLVDARETLRLDDNVIVKLQLFHVVNQYFCSQPTLKLGRFHRTFLDEFTIIVNNYMDALESQLKNDLANSFTLEKWLPASKCCQAVEGATKALQSFKGFIEELSWPEETFAVQLELKVAGICAQRFQESAIFIDKELKMIMESASLSVRYTLPPQVFTMINTMVYLSAQVMQLCSSQRVLQSASPVAQDSEDTNAPLDIDEYLSVLLNQSISVIINALCQPLEGILTKLSKFDPDDGFLSRLKMMLPTSVPVESFNHFVSINLGLISKHLVDTIFNNFVVNWYECQLRLIQQWLEERPNFSLQETQHQSIVTLVKALHDSFIVFEMPPEQLESDTYIAVQDRLRIERSHVDLLSVGKN